MKNKLWRLLLCVSLALSTLAGCETTGNVATDYDFSKPRDTGLALFSVTHDRDDSGFSRNGNNVAFFVSIRDAVTGAELPRAFSQVFTDPSLSAVGYSWGHYYVREFAAGRYEFAGWKLIRHLINVTEITPRKQPPPLVFDVLPGSVIYLGNIHASIVWGQNPLKFYLAIGAVPEIRDEAVRDIPLILKEYPQLQGKIQTKLLPMGPWLAQ